MSDITHFTNTVMARIPFIADDEDYKMTMADCETLFEEGFTVSEAVDYLSCMEHINPDIDEDEAVRKMKFILEAVRERRNSQ